MLCRNGAPWPAKAAALGCAVTRRVALTLVFCALASRGGLAQSDPLPSWNDGAAKKSITDFVARVTTQGGADFVPSAERIATFDNDGTLWCEQPYQVQVFFLTDRVRELAAKDLMHTFMIGVYFFPLLGGYLADRYLGQRKAVLFGAILLTIGHTMMGFEGDGGAGFHDLRSFGGPYRSPRVPACAGMTTLATLGPGRVMRSF